MTPDGYLRALKTTTEFLGSRLARRPDIILILGSGLTEVATAFDPHATIPYPAIPNWPVTTVEGHAGELRVASYQNLELWICCGRVHLYEGYSPWEVCLPIRVAGLLGATVAVLTCAAGSLNPTMQPGDVVLIRDHLNFQGSSPLVGLPDGMLGPRHVDMTNAYSLTLRRLARRAAKAAGLNVQEGTYAAVLGPQYETPAEISFLRMAGADLVGMSTVAETMAARQLNLEVVAFAVVTNPAAGYQSRGPSHQEVLEVGRTATQRLNRLLPPFLALLSQHLQRV